MPQTEVAIYGAGGMAREIVWLIQGCNHYEDQYRVVCFIDDDPALQQSVVNGIPVIKLEQAYTRFPQACVVGAVGSPHIRQQLMEKAASTGFEFATLVHPSVLHSPSVQIGAGTVICAGNILTVDIVLGEHVQINLNCTVAHDVVIGDYATLAPGVHVSGNVQLGRRVYVGTGAVIINGTAQEPLVVGEDAIIGAGACVTRSVPAGQVVVGVPARPLQQSK